MKSINPWYKRVFDILQDMEDITGPELDEYILVLETIKQDIDKRIENAKAIKARKKGE